jgi:hypothetical protein
MADTYGVTAQNVADELTNLFPGGFTATTTPTYAQVVSAIADADAIVTMKVLDVTGTAPALTDKAAALARRYVIAWVKRWVMSIVYTGNDPERLAQALKPYSDVVTEIWDAILLLGAQAVGTGAAASRVIATSPYPTRDLIVTDAELDGALAYRTRLY